MRDNSIGGALFIWVCVAIIASVVEWSNVLGATAGVSGATNIGTLYALLHPDPLNIGVWFYALFNVLTLWFNGSLWQGDWIWIYYIVWISIMGSVGWEVIKTILSAGVSILSGAARAVGSIIGLGS